MERRYFYVSRIETGWEVREDDGTTAWSLLFSDSAEALLSAVDSARLLWETRRLASGVRVQDPHGQWRDEILFGSGLPIPMKHPARLTRRKPALGSS